MGQQPDDLLASAVRSRWPHYDEPDWAQVSAFYMARMRRLDDFYVIHATMTEAQRGPDHAWKMRCLKWARWSTVLALITLGVAVEEP